MRRMANGVRMFAVLAAMLLSSLCSEPAWASACEGKVAREMLRGGFPKDLIGCDDTVMTFKYLGQTRSRHGYVYKIYLLSYHFLSAGGALHGGARLALFDRHGRYLGHYHLAAGYHYRIVGSDVVLTDVPATEGNRVPLDGPPPDPAWLDGFTDGFDQ
jgi:hypothetical protein